MQQQMITQTKQSAKKCDQDEQAHLKISSKYNNKTRVNGLAKISNKKKRKQVCIKKKKIIINK